ncbi:unnamed protein product [Calypogeia fissa]
MKSQTVSENPKPKCGVELDTGTSDQSGTELYSSGAARYPESKVGEDKSTIVPLCSTSTQKCHHYLAIFIGWFLGNALLFLWNAILNAGDYFYSVFPDYHPSRVLPLLYIPVAFAIACGFLITAKAPCNIRLRVLNGFSIFLMAAISIIIVSACGGAHLLGTRLTFIAICVLVVTSSIGEGVCGGGLLGEFSFMDPVYLQAFNAGMAASGIATTGLRMITKYIFGDTVVGLRRGGVTFFAMSAVVHLVGIFLYAIVFSRLEGVKTYRQKAVAQESKTVGVVTIVNDVELGHESGRNVASEKSNLDREWSKMDLLFENWDYVLDAVVLYAVTFSINPGFLYENTGSHTLGTWYPLILLAIFNSTDSLSRIFRIDRLFMRSRRYLGVSCCGLVLFFIPGFYFGARYGGTSLMMTLCGLLGAANGYLTVCIFDSAPVGFKVLNPEQLVIRVLSLFAMGKKLSTVFA